MIGNGEVNEFLAYLGTVVTKKEPTMNDEIKAGDLIEIHLMDNGLTIKKIRCSVYMAKCYCLATTNEDGSELLLKDISNNNLIIKLER